MPNQSGLPSLHRVAADPQMVEELLHAVIHDSPVPIALTSDKGVLFEANRAFCEMLGRERSELVGRGYQWFTLSDDMEADDAGFARLVAGEDDKYTLSKRYMTKFGQTVCVDLTVHRIPGKTETIMEFAVAHAVLAQLAPEYMRPTVTKDGRTVFRASFSIRDVLEDWFKSVGVSNRVGYVTIWTTVSSAFIWLSTMTGSYFSGYLSQREELAKTRVLLEARVVAVDELKADLKTALSEVKTEKEERQRLAAQVDALLKIGRRIDAKVGSAPPGGD